MPVKTRTHELELPLASALPHHLTQVLPIYPTHSAASIPIFDEIVLSLSNMNRVVSFDDRSGVVVCEAG